MQAVKGERDWWKKMIIFKPDGRKTHIAHDERRGNEGLQSDWAWARIELATTDDYITGRGSLALAAPNMGEKSCWYTECRGPVGARLETADMGIREHGCEAARKVFDRTRIVDAREALRIAGHPSGAAKACVPAATHVRALIEMAWEQTYREAIEGAEETVTAVLSERAMGRWTGATERLEIVEIGEEMKGLWKSREAQRTWATWLAMVSNI